MGQTATLSEVDALVRDRLLPLRERIVDAFAAKHPHWNTMIGAFLNNKENKAGMQVVENGQIVGQYTFHLTGMRIRDTEYGKLDSAINHPLMGLIKPYLIVERRALEKMIGDEANLTNEPFSTAAKYLPDITFKFLQ